jgi:hypothetical protein
MSAARPVRRRSGHRVGISFSWHLEGQLDSRLADSCRVDPAIIEELEANIPNAGVELNRLGPIGTDGQQRWGVRIAFDRAAQSIGPELRGEIAAQLGEVKLVQGERLFRGNSNILYGKAGDVEVQRREIRVFLRPPTLRSALD